MDPVLGPEMRSTGEVMGIDDDFALGFAKSQLAAGQRLPFGGGVLFSVKDPDKPALVEIARGFRTLGFQALCHARDRRISCRQGFKVAMVHKIRAGRPNIIDRIKSQDIALLINTPMGRYTADDSFSIRRAALEYDIPYTTTIAAAKATLEAIRAVKTGQAGGAEFAGISPNDCPHLEAIAMFR